MTALETTLKETYDWAIDRMHILSEISSHKDATSIQQEFSEWFDESIEEYDVVSLEFFGDQETV